MDKMRTESADMTAKNIEKIGELFPNAITESRDDKGRLKKAINFDMLQQILSSDILEGDEAYEFTWVGKKAAIVEAGKPIRKTLRPSKEESKGWDTTKNLYIEGDNLEVMKLLQESYLSSIKLIYIDPPYNTGSDFLYQDDFRLSTDDYDEAAGVYDDDNNRLFQNTSTNGRFHSDWCSLLYSRLIIARNLLSEDGVILINMDENEISNLQKLCAEVFGETNDLGTIIWDKRNPKGDAKGVSYQHEYILVYAKNKVIFTNNCKMQRPKKNAEVMLKKAAQLFKKVNATYSLEEANKDFATWLSGQTDFSGGERAYNRMDEKGDLYQSVSMGWPNKKKAPDDYFVPLIHPETKKPCPVPERGWRNPSSTMNELLNKNLILFGIDETTQPRRKYLLKENMYENIPSLLYYGGSDTELLARLGIPFDTPKVVSICQDHIASFTGKNDTILDFFSGSATAAHAVMQQNADEEGSKRKFIMVQLPEKCPESSEAYKAGFNDICELGKERIRRAGEKIKEEAGLTAQNLDIGFRVLKLDSSNMKDVYYSAAEYTQMKLDDLTSNIKEDRTELDLLFGCLLEWGLPLSMPYTSEEINGVTIHTYNDGDLIACFAEKVPENVIREVANRQPLRAVFRDSSFANSPAKINVEEIFKLIAPNTSVKVL
ncbi:MAG: site-specific DNA-methyltransferase [Ruminiclostridium sp.]|nr:site-specific DNA-methyltransferase [Ruminiclostridium sp.]